MIKCNYIVGHKHTYFFTLSPIKKRDSVIADGAKLKLQCQWQPKCIHNYADVSTAAADWFSCSDWWSSNSIVIG